MKNLHSASTLESPSGFLFPLLFALLLFASYRSCSKIKSPHGTSSPSTHVTPKKPGGGSGAGGITTLVLGQAPKHVRQLIGHLKKAKHFSPPKGYKGGRFFRNRESTLPRGKKYYEYDVHPDLPGVSRSAERLVVDQQKQHFYYTKNHYRTFVKINVK